MADAMMRGKMDDTEESPENEIIFLGETLHFFSPNRYRIFGFALTNSDASALNFIGVRACACASPVVFTCSRATHAIGEDDREAVRPPSQPASPLSFCLSVCRPVCFWRRNCLWRKTWWVPWDLPAIRLWTPPKGNSRGRALALPFHLLLHYQVSPRRTETAMALMPASSNSMAKEEGIPN